MIVIRKKVLQKVQKNLAVSIKSTLLIINIYHHFYFIALNIILSRLFQETQILQLYNIFLFCCS